MFEKIKNLIVSARNKVASMSPKIMAVIVGYFIAVVLLVLTPITLHGCICGYG